MTPARRTSILILVAGLLTLASLACNMPAPRLGGPRPPRQAVQPSVDALESFNEKWRALNLATPDGPFTLTFTEAELTSVVAAALEQAEADSGTPLPVQDVQVILQDGAIYAYGTANIDPIQVNGLIVAAPTIGPDGRVSIAIRSVEFGPLEIDPELIDEIAASVEASINAPLQASSASIVLTDITISDGQLTISGTITP